MDVREYHFSRRDGEAAAEGALPRELPVGRVEETRRGPRFYFTGRLRSPERIVEFAEKHPDLVLLNEKGEVCDPRRVAGEIRGMKIGTAGAGSRCGSGMGVPYNDLSAWDVEAVPRPTARRVLTVLLVISLCFNVALLALQGWQNGTASGVGTYVEQGDSGGTRYLSLLEDGTYLYFPLSGTPEGGTYLRGEDGLCALTPEGGGQRFTAVFSRPNRLSVLLPDGSTVRYEKLRTAPSFVEQAVG